MPANEAAWLPAKHARLEFGSAPCTPPRENEMLVENHAVAINPVDWTKQALGDMLFPYIRYRFVLGADLEWSRSASTSPASRAAIGCSATPWDEQGAQQPGRGRLSGLHLAGRAHGRADAQCPVL